jgi:hypothetical protein
MYKILKEIKLWDNGYIKLVDSSEFNMNEGGRLKAVQLAKICYGKCGTESKNPQKLWDKLAKEGTKDNPYSRSFELIPVVYDEEKLIPTTANFYRLYYNNEKLTRFEHYQDEKYYVSYRALANVGININSVPYNTANEIKDFKVVIANLPMFVVNHVKTHCMLSSIMNSARYMSSKDFDYWLPTDLKGRLKAYLEDSNSYALQDIVLKLFDSYTDNTTVDLLLDEVSPNRFEEIFRALGYPKEIYQRQMAGFRYGQIVMAGWKNDPLVWDHMIELRSGTHTQKETREFIDGLVEVFR